MGKKPSSGGKKDLRKEILAKAAVDPSFRRKLFKDPELVFNGKLTDKDKEILELLKKSLPAIDSIIGSLSGEILCGGGGCGGLA